MNQFSTLTSVCETPADARCAQNKRKICSHYRELAVVLVCWRVSLELLHSLLVIACVHKKSPRASIKPPQSSSSTIELPLSSSSSKIEHSLHVSVSLHGYRLELHLPPLSGGNPEEARQTQICLWWAEERTVAPWQFISVQQLCAGTAVYLQKEDVSPWASLGHSRFSYNIEDSCC